MKTNKKTFQLTLFTLFAAIILMLSMTPLGFINLAFVKATIVHVPVIIGSILLGPKAGAGLGLIFGFNSMINNTLAPSILSFAFSPLVPVIGTESGSPWAIVIALLPRILVGVFPFFVAKTLKAKNETFALGLAAFVGSMTNTVLVMGLIYILFKDSYSVAQGIETSGVAKTILTVVFTNGVIEAVVATLITVPVTKIMFKIKKN